MNATRSEGVGTGISARVVVLLALAASVSYVDRGNLATAGPLIRGEFAPSNAQFGFLPSAFIWSYAPGQLLVGWLAERLDARGVLATGLALWAIATALMGIANNFRMLLILRVLLGLGESAMYPAGFKILAHEAREDQRGRANGFLAAGQLSGPAFGTLVGGLLMASGGWRISFVALGCASLLWLWPWLKTSRPAARLRSGGAPDGPPMWMILHSRELWASCVGAFCEVYCLYLVLTWLPVYLVKEHGLSMAEMAQLGFGVYALAALTSFLTGWLSDRWLRAGAGTNRVRKTGCSRDSRVWPFV